MERLRYGTADRTMTLEISRPGWELMNVNFGRSRSRIADIEKPVSSAHGAIVREGIKNILSFR